MRRTLRRTILIVVICLAVVVGAGALYLARLGGDELKATGHEAPAHAVRAGLTLALARATVQSDSPWEGAYAADVLPLFQPLPGPSAGSCSAPCWRSMWSWRW